MRHLRASCSVRCTSRRAWRRERRSERRLCTRPRGAVRHAGAGASSRASTGSAAVDKVATRKRVALSAQGWRREKTPAEQRKSLYIEKEVYSMRWSGFSAVMASGHLPVVAQRKKERKHTPQTRDRGGGQGPHLHEQDFGRTIRGTGGALLLLPRKRKKENRQPKGGMGGRYTATTQGF